MVKEVWRNESRQIAGLAIANLQSTTTHTRPPTSTNRVTKPSFTLQASVSTKLTEVSYSPLGAASRRHRTPETLKAQVSPVTSATPIFHALSVVSYAIFFLTFLYAVRFIGNLVVPENFGLGSPGTTVASSAGGLLAARHLCSAAQRDGASIGSSAHERDFVPDSAGGAPVLFSSIALIAVFAFWQPLGGVIWNVRESALRTVLYFMFGLGFGIVLVSISDQPL